MVIYLLREKSGFGTRLAGAKMREKIISVYRKAQIEKDIIIDFDGVSIISSGYADELLGKLVAEIGFYEFNKSIKLKNMNSLIQNIVQRSVAQRMAEAINE